MVPRTHEEHEGSEYNLGRHRVPVDVVAAPRHRPRDVTRPIASALERRKGPTLDDLARLDAGELTMLRVARYRLDRRLGKGGMASVYQGMHTTLARPVAVKVLTRDLSEHPDALARFMTEARLGAQVQHPNVVEVFDFGATPEGIAYLVMPLHEGEDLRTTLKRERTLAWPRARALLLQLCAALEAVHAQGIVHRDVKPSNCLRVVEAGHERLLLADFGVACKQRGAAELAVVGTPEYMSPEQARGEAVDTRSDIYALGIMLGELITGHLPFTGRTTSAVLDGQIHDPPPSLATLAEPGSVVPVELEAIYRRALAKDPCQRFAKVGEFAAALLAVDAPVVHVNEHAPHSNPHDRTLAGRPFVEARPRWRPLAIAAGITVAIGLATALATAGGAPIHAAATSSAGGHATP
ncbi:serine/threonine-protein kinase [Nannocystaceae bacterium ST9]